MEPPYREQIGEGAKRDLHAALEALFETRIDRNEEMWFRSTRTTPHLRADASYAWMQIGLSGKDKVTLRGDPEQASLLTLADVGAALERQRMVKVRDDRGTYAFCAFFMVLLGLGGLVSLISQRNASVSSLHAHAFDLSGSGPERGFMYVTP